MYAIEIISYPKPEIFVSVFGETYFEERIQEVVTYLGIKGF